MNCSLPGGWGEGKAKGDPNQKKSQREVRGHLRSSRIPSSWLELGDGKGILSKEMRLESGQEADHEGLVCRAEKFGQEAAGLGRL